MRVTFKTLIGRLQRLKSLAEAVRADDKTEVLSTILLELKPHRQSRASVGDEMLGNLRGRLITGEPSSLLERRER